MSRMSPDQEKQDGRAAEELRRENARLREIISAFWPIVTRHSPVSFWGPIENELRGGGRR